MLVESPKYFYSPQISVIDRESDIRDLVQINLYFVTKISIESKSALRYISGGPIQLSMSVLCKYLQEETSNGSSLLG